MDAKRGTRSWGEHGRTDAEVWAETVAATNNA